MKFPLIGAVMAFLIVFAGCGQQATSPDSTSGPVTASTTIPPEAQKLLDEYVGPDGDTPPAATLNALNADQNPNGYDVFSVTFVWGDILGGSSPAVTTDWSGGLDVEGEGHVRVGYQIDFEPGEDYILPANSEGHVQWVSYTNFDFDGLNFVVFLSPVTPSNVPAAIVFQTGPFTLRLTYDQLFRYSAFYPLDESRGVLVHSQVIWQNSCPGGTMVGDWIKETNNSSQGRFHGEWLDHTGEPIGYMSGQFWTNDNGSREFSGNVSGIITDQVIAELRGAWIYDDTRLCPICGDGHGLFYGRFNYIDGSDRQGWLKGVFGDYNLPPDADTLPYYGFWRTNCPYVSPHEPSATVR
jgi:hypothetical protein